MRASELVNKFFANLPPAQLWAQSTTCSTVRSRVVPTAMSAAAQRTVEEKFKSLSRTSIFENWAVAEQKTAEDMVKFFNSEIHEIVRISRRPQSLNIFSSAFTILALDKKLTRMPILELQKRDGVLDEVKTLFKTILSESKFYRSSTYF